MKEGKVKLDVEVGDFLDYGDGRMEVIGLSIKGIELETDKGVRFIEPWEVLGVDNPFDKEKK